MISDARHYQDRESLEADVCIVGAGAAGIALALRLDACGLRVLLLEAGGRRAEAATQALYLGEVCNPALHSPLHRYRERRLGGSTAVWGGRCVPLDPIDFEAREYMPYSGWPIGPADLAAYYPAANQLCEAGEYAYTLQTAFDRQLPAMIPGFQGGYFSDTSLERFSRPTHFGERYVRRLRGSRSILLMLHANVTALRLHPETATVVSAQVRTLDGLRLSVRADRFVLAAGGLEVARLLLASRDVMPQGLGNAHDVVGRYYMCHVAGTLGSLQLTGDPAWHGYDISDDGVYCRRRLALRPQAQRKLRIGNFIARLHHPRISNPSHRSSVLSSLYLARALVPYEYAQRLYDKDTGRSGAWLDHLANVLRAPHQVAGFAWHLLRDRRLARRKFPSLIVPVRDNRFSLDFHAEQEPQPESRVQLSGQCDALGMPRLRVDWRYSRRDVLTVQRGIAALAADVRDSGVGRLHYQPQDIEAEMTRYGAYGGHHLGTARMGSDPRRSVVDADCRVHGVANLYIAGGAVFPSSSQANPTLTIVALALRLADHLRDISGVPGGAAGSVTINTRNAA